MTLAANLVDWASDRPDWQKAALDRFCKNAEYSKDEIMGIADQLVAGTFPTTPNITVDDVPGGSSTGDKVLLTSLGQVAGVNALVNLQTLTFAETGLTVIYGHNASGKSGYARLLREAVTARVKGDLLGDVFSHANVTKSAQVEYSVAGSPRTWSLGDDDSTALSSVRFYDVDCGEDYIETAAEITYRPYALTLLDRLQAHCRSIREELDQRFKAKHDESPDLPALQAGTATAAFVTGLSKDTTDEQIKAATTLPSDHESVLARKMQEEIRLKASDPNKEKTRLTSIAGNLDQLRQHLERLDEAVSQEAVDNLIAQRKAADDLREAAKLASAEQFSKEPLTGVGSATWRALWEAARAYSTTEAFHEHEFPAVEEGTVCVLCQQPLAGTASDRLARFERFVADTTSQQAERAEEGLRRRRDELALLETTPSSVTAALAMLQATDRLELDEDQIRELKEFKTEFMRDMKDLDKSDTAAMDRMYKERRQDLLEILYDDQVKAFEKAEAEAVASMKEHRGSRMGDPRSHKGGKEVRSEQESKREKVTSRPDDNDEEDGVDEDDDSE